ncbi:putative membrane protein [Escherichia coli P0302293.9]|nr:putative membrane protein [Escherichia coli P0302308.1]EMX15131.1 putative membrane protein [Escherichia coli P0302293.2]ENC94911.1 putative membrane protein [Escherichia coli P0302308.11]ENC95166.1 putative membrane protein [Escherichia coli P0302308.10]END17498.1 putative membrane protein [Escherichia coli P0302308.2]END18256.1 putative membrane protein [Escherichia coli P0302308.3]END18364.1 putative membrane protein [Escherichia coli P0302308.4]END23118.1 putative membrane protein [Es
MSPKASGIGCFNICCDGWFVLFIYLFVDCCLFNMDRC